MSLELLGRFQKECSITGSALYETVVAIAERVNRKVRVLRLHAQAATLLARIEQLQVELGRTVCAGVSARGTVFGRPVPAEVDRLVAQAVDRIHQLKQTSIQLDAQIRELKLDAMPETLLRLQQELHARGAAIERVIVGKAAPADGRPLGALAVPPSVRVAAVLRGPFLLAPGDEVTLQEGDVVVLIGAAADLDGAAAWLSGS